MKLANRNGGHVAEALSCIEAEAAAEILTGIRRCVAANAQKKSPRKHHREIASRSATLNRQCVAGSARVINARPIKL